jgi:hypothetical protein
MRTSISGLKKSPISKTLKATLHRKWFDLIAAGEKTEEYREVKPYWTKRLSRKYDYIEFRNGYNINSPAMIVEYLGYATKTILHPVTGTVETVYALKLGRVIEIKNYEVQQKKSAKDLSTY